MKKHVISAAVLIIVLSAWMHSSAIQDYPHIDNPGCPNCHGPHSSGVTVSQFGASFLTNDFVNTLCFSCHKTGGTASTRPFTPIMQAISSKGTSHRWDRPMPASDNPANRFGLRSAVSLSTTVPFQSGQPSMRAMLIGEGNTPLCNVCHDMHRQINTPWNPYAIFGTATAGDSATLTDSARTWVTNQFSGNYLRIFGTTGSDTSQISFNTSDTITLSPALGITINPGDRYLVAQGMNFLRYPNNVNQFCEDCHYYRSPDSGQTNVRVWVTTGRPLSHPVGLSMSGTGDPAQYNAVPREPQFAGWSTQGGSRFELNGAGDTNATNNIVVDTNGRIRCMSCHGVHYTDSITTTVDQALTMGTGDGNLLRRSRNDLCHGCHKTDRNAPADPDSIKGHSSALTSSAYWGGNWGVSGGKYGEFQCVTCHAGHGTNNIYLIIPTVSSPNAPADSFPGSAVDFRYLSTSAGDAAYTMGDDGIGTSSRTTSTKVCEVCHSQTLYHRYNASGQTVFSHENGSNCTGCHSHKAGFRSAPCDSCHGAPPGSGADNNETAEFAQSHGKHYDYSVAGVPGSYGDASNASTPAAYVFRCGRCHSTNAGDHGPGQTDGITDVKLNARTGVVTPQEFYTFGASAVLNTPPPGTISYQDTDGRCFNVYCHGNFGESGITANAPVWGSSATGVCGTCHGATAATPPSGGSHVRHVSSATYGYTCAICHFNTAADWTTLDKSVHVNERSDVRFSPDARASTGLYNGLSTFGRFPVTSAAYYTCTTTYCHSDGQKDAVPFNAPNQSAQWGLTRDCTGCHGGPSGGAAPVMTNASHYRHVTDQTPVSGAVFACETCHAATVTLTTNINNYANHVNKQVNVDFVTTVNLNSLATYSGSLTPGDAFGICSNVYCHSDGNIYQATPGSPAVLPTWGTAWSNNRCANCHGDGSNNAWPAYASGPPASTTANSHMTHAPSLGGNTSCLFCHAAATIDGTNIVAGGGSHLNRQEDSALIITTVDGSYILTPGNSALHKTCVNASCHGRTGVNTPPWGSNTGNHQCTKCHGLAITSSAFTLNYAAPGYLGTGSDLANQTGIIAGGVSNDAQVGAHDTHLRALNTISNALPCDSCHAVPVSPLPHILSSSPAKFVWSSLATRNGVLSPVYSTGNSTCTNVYCHGASMPGGDATGTDRTPAWTDGTYLAATLDTASCGKCHGFPPAPASGHPVTTSPSAFPVPTCVPCHPTMTTNGNSYATLFSSNSRHINGVLEAVGSCLGCHDALIKNDFVRPSRHVSNGISTLMVTDFDCIVCHAAGSPLSSGANVATTDLHGMGSTTPIALRNVDNVSTDQSGGTAGTNFWWWSGRRGSLMPKGTSYTAARDNMDSFCMGCHDMDGSSGIAVDNNNNGLILAAGIGTIRRHTASFGGMNTNPRQANVNHRPFNTNDNLQNGYDSTISGSGYGIGRYRWFTYGRVVNVKSQFNSGNMGSTNWASHHNLNQFTKRYDTNDTTAGIGLPTTIWTTYVTKEGKNVNGTGAGTGMNAGLHCSDCHLNEVNAHGSVNSWYMLAGTAWGTDADVSPTLGNSTTTAEISCFRCHVADVYAVGGGSGGAGRTDHTGRCNNIDVVTGTAVEAPFGNMCHGCHGGFGDGTQGVNRDIVGTTSTGRGALGAIHGNNETYTPGGGSATKRYRFISGAAMRFWNPATTATTIWTTSKAGSCYTLSAADQWSACSKHSGTAQTTNKARQLAY